MRNLYWMCIYALDTDTLPTMGKVSDVNMYHQWAVFTSH